MPKKSNEHSESVAAPFSWPTLSRDMAEVASAQVEYCTQQKPNSWRMHTLYLKTLRWINISMYLNRFRNVNTRTFDFSGGSHCPQSWMSWTSPLVLYGTASSPLEHYVWNIFCFNLLYLYHLLRRYVLWDGSTNDLSDFDVVGPVGVGGGGKVKVDCGAVPWQVANLHID